MFILNVGLGDFTKPYLVLNILEEALWSVWIDWSVPSKAELANIVKSNPLHIWPEARLKQTLWQYVED